jgi:hypothetical protein
MIDPACPFFSVYVHRQAGSTRGYDAVGVCMKKSVYAVSWQSPDCEAQSWVRDRNTS